MAELFHDPEEAKKHNKRIYVDRKYFRGLQDQMAALRGSTWVYIGNLSFKTSEVQIHALFSRIGSVKRVIMGLNSREKTPCGFAFVEYLESQHALDSVGLISGTILDDRQIRVELDFGYKVGRHFGRGKSGGQVRDDRQGAVDPGRVWAKNSSMDNRLSRPLSTTRHGEAGVDDGLDEFGRGKKRDRDHDAEQSHQAEQADRDEGSADVDAEGSSGEDQVDDGDDSRSAKRRKRSNQDEDEVHGEEPRSKGARSEEED